ncbi:MAG: DUF721 domain-containing protein [Candidatus Kerfeldbacteria bacterium]|nr:DUF721 domain-containing protein [Candidatus Kerfeldbacteria bacterium]
MATRLADLLAGAVGRAGATEQVLAAQILRHTASLLRELLGPDSQQFVFPRSFRRGALTLVISNQAVSLEIRYHERQLLDRLRQQFPRISIERVQLVRGDPAATSDEAR